MRLVVGVVNGWLMVGGGDAPQSRVLPVGPESFHPTGAPAVEIRFEFDADGATAGAVTIVDGPASWRGERQSP